MDTSPMMQQTNLLTTSQAAETLHKDRTTLTRWVHAGRMHPAMQLEGTGAYLFTVQEVERVAAELRAETGHDLAK